MVKDQKNLIVFYSHEGNIRAIAHHLQKVVGADLYDIELVAPYPEDNKEFVKTVREEIKAKSGREYIKQSFNVSDYDNVFIGSANWGKTLTPVLKQFLIDTDLSTVTIYPYFSHGGTGLGNMPEEVAEMSNCTSIKEPLLVYQTNLTDEQVEEWLQK